MIEELSIESIAGGGDGVARHDGLVVFVPRTAPGDRARVRYETRGRFARGTMEALVAPSAVRVEPACVHYVADRCGGCQLQHLAYSAQLDAKSGIVRDAITRIGHAAVAAPSVEASPTPWGYRRKLTLAMRHGTSGWIAGLHAYDDPERVFALRECPITHDSVLSVWRDVLAAADDLPVARALRGSVRTDPDDGRAWMVLEGGTAWPRSDAFFARLPALAALWWQPQGTKRRLLRERGAAEHVGASFAQVNAGVAERLRAAVVEATMRYAPQHVVDAYAGVGDVALLLDARAVRVTAIERDADAAAWSSARLGPRSRSMAAAVEDALGSVLPADVVILNPPRIGVDRVVTEMLERPPRARALVYVSCNPATLARDVARLPSYRVASLQSFDMFPQTAHVETLCELRPEAA